MIEEIEEWLAAKNVDLWANWRVSDPEQRAKAAAWFQQQMEDYDAFRMANQAKKMESTGISWDVVA